MTGTAAVRVRSTGTFRQGRLRAAWAVAGTLALLSPFTFPVAPDGLLVLRTAEALAFEGTFVLPPAAPGTELHPWFFRPAPFGQAGVVAVYQPLSSVWRAAALLASAAVPSGFPRGLAADLLLVLGPILLTALAVFPLARVLRYGGLGARAAPVLAAGLILGSFLGPLAGTDFSEPLLVLLVLIAFERSLRSIRLRRHPEKGLVAAGFLGVLANLVKPVAGAALPALALPVLLVRDGRERRRRLLAFIAGALPATALFLAANALRTGRILEVGYADQPLGDIVSPLWTLLRITILPNRGLFWLAPTSMVALAGIALLLRSRTRRIEGLAALVGFGGFFAVNLAYWAWEGGMGWAPRYLAPAVVFLAPGLAAGARAWPRATGTLVVAGFLLNVPGYLLDADRIYRVAAAEPGSLASFGPFVPLHGDPDAPGELHRIQRPHYVPARAGVFLGPRILLRLLLDGEGPATGGAPPGQRKDSVLLRMRLGEPLVPSVSRSGQVFLDEATQGIPVDLERSYRFAVRAVRWNGPPVDSLAIASYLALRTGRVADAVRFAEAGLRLDPRREDLRTNLAIARSAAPPAATAAPPP